ncbi:MAG TPA: hypothetical protein VJG32_00875 [Anaerolineae bacterium]|nr:hypothetical protein [Anaerolineae bacterium]
MAAPGRALRPNRFGSGELYRRHVQRKKVIALIIGLLLLPVSILMIIAYDRGPLGRSFSQAFGFSIDQGLIVQGTPTAPAIAQAPSPTPLPPTPTPCLDTVFNGLVFDAETEVLLGGVEVTASFGASAVTSPDGEYNMLVCYDPQIHDGFSLAFEKQGYESASLDVVTTGYPGISFQIEDMGLYSIQTPTATATLFQPPRQTPLPTSTPTLFQPPRQTPRPTETIGGSQAGPTPSGTVTATAPSAQPSATPTGAATSARGTATPTRPPEMLPNTGLQISLFPGQAFGFVLLAIALMFITAGLWPMGAED